MRKLAIALALVFATFGSAYAQRQGRQARGGFWNPPAGSRVNPLNPGGGNMNCGLTTLSTVAAIRGVYVPANSSGPFTTGQIAAAAGTQFVPATRAQSELYLRMQGHGADAMVFGRDRNGMIGHFFNAVNVHGNIVYLDAQNWTATANPPLPIEQIAPLSR